MAALIIIKDISCYGYHGALAEEQVLGQEFRVSLELNMDTPAPEKDLLSETVDYRDAVETVRRVIEGPPRRLLETLAEEIAAGLLALPGIKGAKVSVCKPHPPIPAVRGGVAVEVRRTRGV
ncbi:MAG TPA: dihydroneopterin aldolase [Bacillota bacterium]|jgi:dihydroneopterin aldolase|nr:dihydroneopterin aldolase [Bacillota bacterium]HOA34886.1 dihydroneopterin aldolase [Bacillota bacterium]HOJ83796.1 dihydroneopterin aldolase [Bacillota bacterium]HOL14596.1 dihydroneopterin aldolase [Bacillota bacterium]HPZ10774.1 dihydroneopterin aldolase [Bacillota bacterium]